MKTCDECFFWESNEGTCWCIESRYYLCETDWDMGACKEFRSVEEKEQETENEDDA